MKSKSPINTSMTCQICTKILGSKAWLSVHVKSDHNITPKEYYDKYFKTLSEGICVMCQAKTEFYKYKYRLFCSNSCVMKHYSPKMWQNQQHIEKMTAVLHKNNTDYDIIEKRKISNRAEWSGNLLRKKELSKKSKERWKNKSYREKMSQIVKCNSYGIKGKFIAENIYFDSALEAIFLYVHYFSKNKYHIIRCPFKFSLEYVDEKGNIRRYHPDFYDEISNTIFEIKCQKWIDKNVYNAKIKIETATKKYKKLDINYSIITDKDLLFNEYNKGIYDYLLSNNIIIVCKKITKNLTSIT